MKGKIILLAACLLFVAGCQNNPEPEKETAKEPEATTVTVPFQGCRTCHPGLKHDANHDFPCTQCHRGNDKEINEEAAHQGLIAKPGHPDFMAETCGTCHPDEERALKTSPHFTLAGKINLVRKHFGAGDAVTGLTDISSSAQPSTPIALADDMLRRRCLRCHLFSPGDAYAKTRRGTGCAACHMAFENGEPASHEIIRVPGDGQCLSCHYANHVGSDYYGRYEHDFGNEYRTPYLTDETLTRAYGVEFHELAPDIHQQAGLSCADCHLGHTNHEQTLSCESCHDARNRNAAALTANLELDGNTLLLTVKRTGNKLPAPLMVHPAHQEYGDRVHCQVCHGQWSFNDTTTHLLRNDSDEYDPWSSLIVQSDSTVERLLDHNLNSDEEELPPVMPDTVTGKNTPGVWYKGFTERRWERMIVQRDADGIIKVFRPMLDLRLSYVDRDEEVVFDNIRGTGPGLLPYTPHTTGKAGIFYLNRFRQLLEPETKPAEQ